jgi:hypothetical protein
MKLNQFKNQTIYILLLFIALVSSNCSHPKVGIPKDTELGKEYPNPNEEKIAKRTLELTLNSIKENSKNGGKVLRDAHPKHHGCVSGSFTVESSVPATMRFGVFANPKTYPIWIRFSNGGTPPKDDKEGDIRGMAIKLIGVDGEKLLEDEKNEKTQDFLVISHPVLPVGDPQDYLDLFEAAFAKKPLRHLIFSGQFGAIRKITALRGLKVPSPLGIRYFSTTPYKLGNAAVKYSARPCDNFNPEMPAELTPNYLKEAMAKHLSEKEACFDFMVQPQTDPIAMPVEDPAEEWGETVSPFVKVATIKIDKQKFDAPEQMEACENLAFTPWHSLPDHKPLGGINRVRKSVYIGISKYRHEANGVPRKEPGK